MNNFMLKSADIWKYIYIKKAIYNNSLSSSIDITVSANLDIIADEQPVEDPITKTFSSFEIFSSCFISIESSEFFNNFLKFCIKIAGAFKLIFKCFVKLFSVKFC